MRENAMRTDCARLFTCLLLAATALCTRTPAMAQTTPPVSDDGVFGAMAKSLTGDVYGDPSRW